jgi:hypothetical protein
MKVPNRITHSVIKYEDLNEQEQQELGRLALASIANRALAGKEPMCSYIVINTDESYIEEIVWVLERHDSWEGWHNG